MPKYLNAPAVRLFESSSECLNLAFVALGLPSRTIARDPSSRWGAVMGLIGSAAEQAMAAILVQVHGETFLQVPSSSTQFKSATRILDDLKTVLTSSTPRAGFLTVGITDPKAHLGELRRLMSAFPVILCERAAGLHAGKGPSRDVGFVSAIRVLEFLKALGQSQRIRPYLETLPTPPDEAKEVKLLIDDLVERLSVSQGNSERASVLRSIFLVLPEVSETAPPWLDAFERIAIAPKQQDVSLLLSVLETATPVRLQKVSTSGEGLSVVVRPTDLSATPISTHMFKRTFDQLADQWRGDSASANGRLTSRTLHLPPDDFVIELFGLGREAVMAELGLTTVTPHELWPFVAAASIKHGKAIPSPYWFLVRMTQDYGQLAAQLKKVFELSSGKNLINTKQEVLDGIKAIAADRPLAASHKFVVELNKALSHSNSKRETLPAVIERNRGSNKALSDESWELILRASQGKAQLGDAFISAMESSPDQAKSYWARTLAECASESEDIGFLISILQDEELIAAKSTVKKSLRLIDAFDNGPPMTGIDSNNA